MSRATLAVDRVLGALTALLLIGAGLFGIAWWSGRLMALPQRLDLAGLGWLPRAPWWPWALGLVGVLLVLAGLRWLAGHLPGPGVSHLVLTGSSAEGKLIVQARPVVSAAAEVLARTRGMRSVRGEIHRDRGQLVARLNATIEPEADLRVVAAAADQVSAQLQQVLQREDLHCRVQLRTSRGNRTAPRVR
jgi:hypothetical protein